MATLALASETIAAEHVILLHGLCRTPQSMRRVERELTKAGYRVLNVRYASREPDIGALAERSIGPAVAQCLHEGANKIHFVTHSAGGILVRSYLGRHDVPRLGRAVMLGPPNQGSEVVDRLGKLWLFRIVAGLSAKELGTGEEGLPHRLGPVNFQLGVIAGSRTINWINSLAFLPGANDGKVTIERTKVNGMLDHLVLPVAHPFLPLNAVAIEQTLCFLRDGRFRRV